LVLPWPKKPYAKRPVHELASLKTMARSKSSIIKIIWTMAQNMASNVKVHINNFRSDNPMKSLVALTAGALIITSTAFAQPMSAPHTDLMTSVPTSAVTVTDWYKQDVYDPSNNKIGQVSDVLVAPDGQINALIIGVGGFLGAGEKDVAVNFHAVKQTTKDNKMYLTMNTTKDALKAAPGFKYDRQKTVWVPDTSTSTTR
jgi:sporulation protein YlmC with PRC-barrel domain